MDTSQSVIVLLGTLLLCTTFIKTATVLSICRYGLGLVGFEFGVVCLVVSVGLSIFSCPPELIALGLPEALLARPQTLQQQAVGEALVPFMQRRVDPDIAKHFGPGGPRAGEIEPQGSSEVTKEKSILRQLAPAFFLSELKGAFQIGCILLIPLVLIDLLSAHLLALVGIQHLSAHAVSLPLKIAVFIAAGGWGLLGRKILGFE